MAASRRIVTSNLDVRLFLTRIIRCSLLARFRAYTKSDCLHDSRTVCLLRKIRFIRKLKKFILILRMRTLSHPHRLALQCHSSCVRKIDHTKN